MRKRVALWCLLTCWLWLMNSTPSFASVQVTSSDRLEMSADDGRVLLGTIRVLRAERDALIEGVARERAETDALVAKMDEVLRSIDEERVQWRARVKAAKGEGFWSGVVTALLVGGGIFLASQ